MNILLTGGSGFIGRNIFERLREEYQIFTPTHRELPIEDYSLLAKYLVNNDINVIVHSAIHEEQEVLGTNLRMFTSILHNLDKVEKVIHFGSGAEYAKTRDLKKVKEEEFGQFIPADNYGLTKYICSLLAKKEAKIVNLRIFGIYGKYENYHFKFISNSIVKNLLGFPIKIKQDVIFDYLYIDDFVQIVRHFIEQHWHYSNCNITPTESISLTEIVDIINDLAEIPSPVTVINKGLNFQYTGDNTRILNEISSLKFTSYRTGIKKLYKYHQNNIRLLDKKSIIKDEFLVKSPIKNETNPTI